MGKNIQSHIPAHISLADIEHVHFEGVSANKKYFDMAIVMKDKTVVHKVDMIPMKELGGLREWLTDIGKTCTHGSVGMQWEKLLSQVRELAKIQKLTLMGFDKNSIKIALHTARGNIETAVT